MEWQFCSDRSAVWPPIIGLPCASFSTAGLRCNGDGWAHRGLVNMKNVPSTAAMIKGKAGRLSHRYWARDDARRRGAFDICGASVKLILPCDFARPEYTPCKLISAA